MPGVLLQTGQLATQQRGRKQPRGQTQAQAEVQVQNDEPAVHLEDHSVLEVQAALNMASLHRATNTGGVRKLIKALVVWASYFDAPRAHVSISRLGY